MAFHAAFIILPKALPLGELDAKRPERASQLINDRFPLPVHCHPARQGASGAALPSASRRSLFPRAILPYCQTGTRQRWAYTPAGVLRRHHRVPAARRLHRAVGCKGEAMLPQPAAQRVVAGGRDHDDPRPTHREHPRAFSRISQVVWPRRPPARCCPPPRQTTQKDRRRAEAQRGLCILHVPRLFCLCQRAGAQIGPDDPGVFPRAASTAVSLPWSQPMSATGLPGSTSSAAAVRRASSVGSTQAFLEARWAFSFSSSSSQSTPWTSQASAMVSPREAGQPGSAYRSP